MRKKITYNFPAIHPKKLSLPFYVLYLIIKQDKVLDCSELIELGLHQVRMQRIFHETSPFSQAQMQIFIAHVHICIYWYVFLFLSLLPKQVNSQLIGLLISLGSCVIFYFSFSVNTGFYILVPVFAVILPRFLCNGFKHIYACLSCPSCIPVNSAILWHTPQVAHPCLSGLPFGKFLLTFV